VNSLKRGILKEVQISYLFSHTSQKICKFSFVLFSVMKFQAKDSVIILGHMSRTYNT
jgi:hypothetical protein